MMTITITDNPYFNRYQWRSQTQDKPAEEPMVVEARQVPAPQAYLYPDDEYQPVTDSGSASLAAALWEMESAKLARANEKVGVVDTAPSENATYGGGIVPIEVIRNQILNRMGLSEGDVADMLPTERNSLENRVDAAVQEMRSNFNNRANS